MGRVETPAHSLMGKLETNEKARELLFQYLSDEQRKCYEKYGHFYVYAENGRWYALCSGWEIYGPIQSSGKPTRCYELWAHTGRCEPQYSNLPKEDSLLAQMLLLQTNTEYVFDTACVNPPHRAEDPLMSGKGWTKGRWRAPIARIGRLG